MTQTKHTPGPWKVFDWTNHSTNERNIGVTHKTADIAHCSGFYSGIRLADEDLANARLIAAAPELLANLKQCVMVLEIIDGDNPAINMAQDAIAKATGAA